MKIAACYQFSMSASACSQPAVVEAVNKTGFPSKTQALSSLWLHQERLDSFSMLSKNINQMFHFVHAFLKTSEDKMGFA